MTKKGMENQEEIIDWAIDLINDARFLLGKVDGRPANLNDVKNLFNRELPNGLALENGCLVKVKK